MDHDVHFIHLVRDSIMDLGGEPGVREPWVRYLIPSGAMAAFLTAIGITRNRLFGVALWTAVRTCASLALAGLIVAAFLLQDALLSEVVLGAAAGYVSSVGLHTAHQYVELRRTGDSRAKASLGTPKSLNPEAERRRIRRRAVLVAGLLVLHAGLLVRVLTTGSLALAALLAVPVAVFAVRLVTYAIRLASLGKTEASTRTPRRMVRASAPRGPAPVRIGGSIPARRPRS